MKFIDFKTGEYNAEINIDCAEELLKILNEENNKRNSETNDEFMNKLFIERLNLYNSNFNEEFDKIVDKINSIVKTDNYTDLEMIRYLKKLDILSKKSTKSFLNILKFLMKGD